jgi:hypothetical protein
MFRPPVVAIFSEFFFEGNIAPLLLLFSISYDRSKASSEASSPLGAI